MWHYTPNTPLLLLPPSAGEIDAGADNWALIFGSTFGLRLLLLADLALPGEGMALLPLAADCMVSMWTAAVAEMLGETLVDLHVLEALPLNALPARNKTIQLSHECAIHMYDVCNRIQRNGLLNS